MDSNVKLAIKTTEVGVNKGRHQKFVGKVIYLTHTRPDIGFSANMVSEFMNNLSDIHGRSHENPLISQVKSWWDQAPIREIIHTMARDIQYLYRICAPVSMKFSNLVE